MRAQIDVLKEVFVEWMAMHELGPDFWIYTPQEWARKEGDANLHKGAELVLAFENGLYSLVNFPSGELNVEDELQDLANGFNYYFELGHSWNLGFYPTGTWEPTPPEWWSYSQKLQDPRWQSKRQRILKRCKNVCDECQRSKPLEVHHCYYRYGRQLWQYPDGAFLALCGDCHDERHAAESRFRLFAPMMRTSEMVLMMKMVQNCQYWFDHNDVEDFFKRLENVPGGGHGGVSEDATLDEHEEQRAQTELKELCESLQKMVTRFSHPHERGDTWRRDWL